VHILTQKALQRSLVVYDAEKRLLAGTQFTCFTGTKDKSTHTDAEKRLLTECVLEWPGSTRSLQSLREDGPVQVSICTVVPVKQVKWPESTRSLQSLREDGPVQVSICTDVPVKQVPVKQVKWPESSRARHSLRKDGPMQVLLCQYLYFCTSKASKLSNRSLQSLREDGSLQGLPPSASLFVLLY
jgi:hypothetical protein